MDDFTKKIVDFSKELKNEVIRCDGRLTNDQRTAINLLMYLCDEMLFYDGKLKKSDELKNDFEGTKERWIKESQ